MTHSMEFFEQLDDYCLNRLEQEQKKEFEAEILKNPELRKELEIQKEIWEAINEKDVLTLRGKLEKVVSQGNSKNQQKDSFELFDELANINEISEVLSKEELISFYDSLPKVHAYHHKKVSNENIHQFYKVTQNEAEQSDFDKELDVPDFIEFQDVEDAILEKDILKLRHTLKLVAKTVEPRFTVEEIDEFINGDLSGDELLEFEKELVQNQSLKEEVHLHKELQKAVRENDVRNLRNKVTNIIQTETSWNVDEKSIEDFVDGCLQGKELEEFNAELKDNTDLRAEVKLRKQVNELLGETDIQDLKNKLQLAKEKTEVRKVKMLIPETKIGQINFWKKSVAVIIILIGIAGVLGKRFVSMDNMYKNYFEAPVWSAERSVAEDVSILQKANSEYVHANWEKTVNILRNAPDELKENPVVQFYAAASLQNMNDLESAIIKYSKVIEHGDNMFIEEAEWYRCLCYLKLENKVEAKNQLLAVMERKGYYENKASAVLRRLKYSFK